MAVTTNLTANIGPPNPPFGLPQKWVGKRGCNSLILRLFAFVCVCARLFAFVCAFICVLGPFSETESLKFARVCVRSFASFAFANTSLYYTLLRHPEPFPTHKQIRGETTWTIAHSEKKAILLTNPGRPKVQNQSPFFFSEEEKMSSDERGIQESPPNCYAPNSSLSDKITISCFFLRSCRVRNYYLIISKRALSCNFLR